MSDGMASETATDLGLAIFGGLRHAGIQGRPTRLPRPHRARPFTASARTARLLENAILFVAVWTVGLGLAFMAYGVTVAVMGR